MSAALFTKPKTPRPFGFAPSKPKTEASIWRGSTRDINEAAERVFRNRATAIRIVRT